LTPRTVPAPIGGRSSTGSSLPTRFADAYAPRDLQIDSGKDVIDKLAWLQATAGSPEHADLIAACLPLLEPFRCSAQVSTALTILKGLS